jgi:AraC family transcriptional regulator, transcriptional activator of the genes for pyochelin and ferripyochelin receptors
VANIISQTKYEEIWQLNTNTQYPDSSDPSDIIYNIPQQFGSGYERWINLPEIELLIIEEELHNDLCVEYTAYEADVDLIEFGFNLSGNSLICGGGSNFLDWQFAGNKNPSELWSIAAGKFIRKIDIHLTSSELLNRFNPVANNQFSKDLTDLLADNSQESYREINKITSEMKLTLEQIINCPFQGITKNIYLQGKCLELIALKLDQISQSTQQYFQKNVLESDDIERVHYAKEILIKNIDNPPSLLELSRLIGLNDYKLKIAFRYCFGTTVFGYLHQQRMDQARLLLLEGKMSIKEIARTIGYRNQSYFTVAFRKRFGINPKSYRLKDK